MIFGFQSSDICLRIYNVRLSEIACMPKPVDTEITTVDANPP